MMRISPFSMEGVKSPFQTQMTQLVRQPGRTDPLDEATKPNFGETFGQALSHVNEAVLSPDVLMHDAMTTNSVDVHDLMIANAKAELLVSITTQVATKVVQAYDKILQIQI